MTNPNPRCAWMSRISLQATSAALTLVIVLGLGAVTTQSAPAQTFTVLHNFTGPDGAYPYAGLVRDAAGNLYGTAEEGGSSGYGVVFKVDTSGRETVLSSFTGGPDGGYPYAGLVRDRAGLLYGTTAYGGASNYGVVFKVDTGGTETVLYSFAGGTTDGCNPYGGLLWDKAGDLYGTTDECGASGFGTVFKVSKTGKETVLHNFAGYPDGAYPYLTSLLMDKAGNLYGVTSDGGPSFVGVVYKLSKSGKETVLYTFTGGTDGRYPLGTPVMDRGGTLYGTAAVGGSSSGGVVWNVRRRGNETVLHNFAGGSSDGLYPFAGVIMDAKGNLYGDTEDGGTFNLGTVYELNRKGTLTVLHSFAGTDGSSPFGGVIRDAKGDLYGTAEEGGSDNYGTVWKLTP